MFCVCVGGGVRLHSYLSEDFGMTTHRHTEDSTPSKDIYTRPCKTLAKNAKNAMFYHGGGGISALRTSMNFMHYYIFEDRESSEVLVIHGCVWVGVGEGVFFVRAVCMLLKSLDRLK